MSRPPRARGRACRFCSFIVSAVYVNLHGVSSSHLTLGGIAGVRSLPIQCAWQIILKSKDSRLKCWTMGDLLSLLFYLPNSQASLCPYVIDQLHGLFASSAAFAWLLAWSMWSQRGPRHSEIGGTRVEPGWNHGGSMKIWSEFVKVCKSSKTEHLRSDFMSWGQQTKIFQKITDWFLWILKVCLQFPLDSWICSLCHAYLVSCVSDSETSIIYIRQGKTSEKQVQGIGLRMTPLRMT